jgi:DNA-binding MarR family transcriptional regulator
MMVPVEAHAVAREILRIVPLVMRTIAAEIRRSEHQVDPPHFRLLEMLAHCPCNLSELADRQIVSSATMSNTVTTLEERGWVKRTRDLHDRRVVRVELTPEGHRVLLAVHEQAEARLAELLASLSPEEYDSLLAGLVVLRGVFQTASVYEMDT